MTTTRLTLLIALPFILAGVTQSALAQIAHSDVFFRYVDSKIEIEPQGGRLVIPQVFLETGLFAQANTNPGFFSESDIGGGTGPSDIVVYNVLDDLLFWSDGDFRDPDAVSEIRVLNNPSFVEDTVIHATTGEQLGAFEPLTNSIGQSKEGEFHSHVDFRLEPKRSDGDDPRPAGAYGIKMSLSSDNSEISDSDPFVIVFQFGIEDEVFETALDDFAELLSSGTTIPGDFDSDGKLTPNDIDLLSIEVVNATSDTTFDLNSDGEVSEADRTFWIDELASSLPGDTDLNGSVDFADFLSLSATFGQAGGWGLGDFDGNQQIEFTDFLALSANFGQSTISASQTVPEPHFPAMLTLLIALSLRSRK